MLLRRVHVLTLSYLNIGARINVGTKLRSKSRQQCQGFVAADVGSMPGVTRTYQLYYLAQSLMVERACCCALAVAPALCYGNREENVSVVLIFKLYCTHAWKHNNLAIPSSKTTCDHCCCNFPQVAPYVDPNVRAPLQSTFNKPSRIPSGTCR